MTPVERAARFSFGRTYTTDRLEMRPVARDGKGALLMEHKNGLREVSSDLTLMFENTREIDKLIEALAELKDAMYKEQGDKRNEKLHDLSRMYK